MKKLININKPGFSPSKTMQICHNADWSHFGDHERLDVKKKLAEQPRQNPIDPKTLETKQGGE